MEKDIKIFEKLPQALLPWYEKNKRELPWRQDRDPYHIWISEIMLQQTRVEAVKGYYGRFLQQLPNLRSLAEADDELLHKLWEGLGYYSRVRNLKKAAQQIVTTYDGVFPERYEDVLALPGIGTYTAGAVCSIAFGQPTPAVDGNVLRVTARVLADATPIQQPAFKKRITQALQAVYPAQAGQFTQALMELGATVCGPNRVPDCENCPCRSFCKGYLQGVAETLPVRQEKRPRKTEKRTVFILQCEGCYGLRKRPESGLLAGLWEFPNLSGSLNVEQAIAYVEEMGAKPHEIQMRVEKKHIFTHIEWDMIGVYMEVREKIPALQWFTSDQLRHQTALPTAFRQFLADVIPADS